MRHSWIYHMIRSVGTLFAVDLDHLKDLISTNINW